MSIPKSAEQYSRFMKKVHVWTIFFGALILLLIVYVKSGYQHKLFQALDTFKPELHLVCDDEGECLIPDLCMDDDEPPRPLICLSEERHGYVDLIELPNEHTFRDVIERGCNDVDKSSETREREARDREERGDSPSLESMV